MSKQKKPSPAVTHFPTPSLMEHNFLSDSEKIEHIASHFQSIMEILGLDLSNDSLKETPQRVAKMYVQEIFSGLKESNFPDIRLFDDVCDRELSHPISVKVGFTSFCEHHFVPMTGIATITYLPKQKIIGLSKIHRIVRYFAARPQLQERLTAQIADSLSLILNNEDIAVSLQARHFCVIARGIRDENSEVTTHRLLGEFKTNKELRREFFEGIEKKG